MLKLSDGAYHLLISVHKSKIYYIMADKLMTVISNL